MTREEKRRRQQEKRQKVRELQQLAKGPLDVPFLLLVLMLTVIGLLMLFSASFPSALYEKGDPLLYIRSQVVFALLGLGAMLLMSKINYDRLKGFSTIALLGSLALLVLVILPGPNSSGKLFGIRQNNAVRWMKLFLVAGPRYQPSELAKLGIILYFATTIEQRRQRMRTFKHGILPYGIILLTFFVLLWKEPHLSGAILICGIGAVMLVVGGIHPAWVGTGTAVVGLGSYAMLFTDLMEKIGYNSDRIKTWLDPWWDIRNKSFQMAQSLIAIGSGGLLGVGFGKGRQIGRAHV